MVGDVGGAGDVVLVAGDQHVVLGGHQVGFDVVGAHPGGEFVAGQGVFGSVSGGAAVSDHQYLVGPVTPVPGVVGATGAGRGGGQGGRGERHTSSVRTRVSLFMSLTSQFTAARRG